MKTIKCVAVGNVLVGRSTLFVRYTKGEYPSYCFSPSPWEEYAATLTVNGEPYTLEMYNMAGDDEYDRFKPLIYQNADVIMLCFSVVDPCSYENITEKWWPELHNFCPNVSIVLVGMKLDLRDDKFTLRDLKAKHERPITHNEGLEMQHKIGAVAYLECSALTKEGVQKVFHAVVSAALTHRVSENKHLKAAMKDGYVPHKDDLFLIHGPGGVGKSSLISMFLGKQRDLARVSTAVADESLNVCPVRDVSTSMFTDKWELVDIDRQERMVAHTSRHLIHKEAGINSTFKIEHVTSPKKENDEETASQQHGLHEKEREHPSAFIKSKRRFPTKVASKLSSLVTKSLTKSIGDDPDNIEALLERIEVGLKHLMCHPEQFLDLILYYSIRLLDSGGQPQFHEVVSIILPAVTGIISVFKLSERLDVHGEVVFYKKGELANDPYKSYLTNEQVIRHDLLAILSEACNRGKSEIPNLAFVGTHLDQQDSCTDETPDQKDELLHSMITEILPEDVQQCIISNGGSLKQVTFRLNTRTPDENDYETAKRLKEALMNQSHVKPKNIPLKWCYYEVALRKLMEKLGRQTLSLEECKFVGFKLGFDLPSLKACLNYLRDLHIISFYDVIPNVVFGSSQVILDKITEFITYSLELKKGSRPLIGVDRKFHQQGIFTLDILNSEACSKHYNKYFTPKDLLKILKSLFIVTEVGPGEYLMPCVLEVSDIFPSPSPAGSTVCSSFILHFSKKSPMLGIYCCTISYLLTKASWKLLTKSGEVVQISRNSIAFELPLELPGKLTFFDPLSSYLEVAVELPAIVAAEHKARLYQVIRDTFFAAIKRAMKTLHYEVRKPELSFLCPAQSSQCSPTPHIARVNALHSLLTCSISPDIVTCPLTPDQRMWLPPSPRSLERVDIEKVRKKTVATPAIQISDLRPTLPQLLAMNLPLRVRENFDTFGTFLLNDETGDKIAVMKFMGDPEKITLEVLREWLAGKGVEVSWESLIATLRKSKLQLMAEQIQMALEHI